MALSLSMTGRLWTRALALAVLAAPLAVHAQAYPSKTLRLILPFPPSGGTDTLGRGIAQTLSAQIGQQVVADNRPGAGGNLRRSGERSRPPSVPNERDPDMTCVTLMTDVTPTVTERRQEGTERSTGITKQRSSMDPSA